MPWKNSRRQPIEPQLPPDLPGGPGRPRGGANGMEGQNDRGTPRANNTEPPKGGAAPDGIIPPFGNRNFLTCYLMIISIPIGFVLVYFLITLTAMTLAAGPSPSPNPPAEPLPGMSADLADFTVGYGGDVYALPAPLEEFLQNGWEVRRMSREEIEQNIPLWMREDEEWAQNYRASERARPAGPDEVLSAGEERGTRLVRGDDEAVLTVWNPGPQPQPLRGCLVYRITAVSYRDPPLMIAGGITQYTDSHYLESLLEPLAPPHVDAEGSRWYNLEYGQGCYYEAVVPWPTFDISSITVCNRPPTRAMPNGPVARGVFLPPVCYTVKKAEQGGTPYAHPDGTAARP